MQQTSKMVEAQNATRLMLFSLQTTKIKLNADHADTQAKLTAIYVPPLSDLPLKELVAQKENSEARAQRALDNLSRQDSWNVALTVGVHQQVNPVAQGAQPYGMVSVNYNLASRAINKHLIAPPKLTTNGKNCKRAMSYAAWRCFGSSWWIAWRCKGPGSNRLRKRANSSTRIFSWSPLQILPLPSTSAIS